MRIVWAAALATVVMLSSPAEACSCVPSVFTVSSNQLPLNARLPFLQPLSEVSPAPTLRTEAGDLVPCDVVPTTASSFTLVPRQPLLPNTKYVVPSDFPMEFTTGTSLDETAPAAPSLSGSRLLPRDLFASGASCDLGGEDVVIDFTNPAAEQVVFEVFTGPSTTSIDLSAPALVVDPSGGVLAFGDKLLCNPQRLAISSMPSLAVQVRAVDIAGNASELSNALQVKGCSATGGTALILLSALFLRRRRAE